MTTVQVNWMTLVLSPIVVVGLVVAFFAARSAAKAGEPMPSWGKTVQGMAIAAVMTIAFAQLTRETP
ncbi:hypothetical protein [Streptomyces flaveus]|uniref:hypothetical protein n=1 Tax=Streptomyces flaveus TaxID=66370 RepID=UPI00331ABA46